MTRWADVEKGQSVRLRGLEYVVAKAKPKGKKTIAVTLERNGLKTKGEVEAKAKVEVVPLHDKAGGQQRWATKREAKAAVAKPLLSPGDPSVTKPPSKAKGSAWDVATSDPERAVLDGLDAQLIAEGDPEVGYYVPPMTLETVLAHLAIFHERRVLPSDPVTALAEHDEEHRAAEANRTLLPINHWHTKKRPTHA